MKKDAYYFLHDANARHDSKMIALTAEHGMAGVGRWWTLVEILREQADYRLLINRRLYLMLSDAWKCTPKEAQTFLEYLHGEDVELLRRDDDAVFSERLSRDMKRWDESKEFWKNRAAKGGAAKAKKDKNPASSMLQADSKHASSTLQANSKRASSVLNEIKEINKNKEPAKPIKYKSPYCPKCGHVLGGHSCPACDWKD